MERKWKKHKKWKRVEIEYERVDGIQKTVIDLLIRKKVPITEKEKRLAKQLEEIEKRGNIIEIPFD